MSKLLSNMPCCNLARKVVLFCKFGDNCPRRQLFKEDKVILDVTGQICPDISFDLLKGNAA